jgi:hypothetical protein
VSWWCGRFIGLSEILITFVEVLGARVTNADQTVPQLELIWVVSFWLLPAVVARGNQAGLDFT